MKHYRNTVDGKIYGYADAAELAHYQTNPENFVELTAEELTAIQNPVLTPEQEQEKAIADLEAQVAALGTDNAAGTRLLVILIRGLLSLGVMAGTDFPVKDRQFYQTIAAKVDELEAKEAEVIEPAPEV